MNKSFETQHGRIPIDPAILAAIRHHFSERFPLYCIAKCDVIWTIYNGISNNTSQILRYKLPKIFSGLIINIFLKSYSQTFPEIMFTHIFPTPKYQGFGPDRVGFHMSRNVRPTYGTLSTMTSRRNSVNATMNMCTGFTYLCDVHRTED